MEPGSLSFPTGNNVQARLVSTRPTYGWEIRLRELRIRGRAGIQSFSIASKASSVFESVPNPVFLLEPREGGREEVYKQNNESNTCTKTSL